MGSEALVGQHKLGVSFHYHLKTERRRCELFPCKRRIVGSDALVSQHTMLLLWLHRQSCYRLTASGKCSHK